MSSDAPSQSVRDVAVHLGVSKNYVYHLIEEKGLPAYRVGNRFRFRPSEVEAWLKKQTPEEVP